MFPIRVVRGQESRVETSHRFILSGALEEAPLQGGQEFRHRYRRYWALKIVWEGRAAKLSYGNLSATEN